MNPHIHTWKAAGKSAWDAVFAIRLASCSAERFDRDAKKYAVSKWLGRQMDLINALYSSAEQRTFALRSIAQPETRVYSAGRVEIALLGRAGGASKAELESRPRVTLGSSTKPTRT